MRRLLLLLILFFAAPAWAQNLVTTPASTGEEVGFTFYKLARAVPDYPTMVRESDAYKAAAAALKQATEDQLALEMRLRFTNFNADGRFITIRTAVKMKASVGVPTGLNVDFGNDPGKGPLYFPYQFGPQIIALVANGIENYSHIRMSPIEASHASRKIDAGAVTMVLQVLPTQVDAKQPLQIESDMPVWLMLGEIAQLVFFNDNAEVVWMYQAPWLEKKDTYRLMQLYKE